MVNVSAFIPNFAGELQNLVHAEAALGSPAGSRAAMIFTSDKRLYDADDSRWAGQSQINGIMRAVNRGLGQGLTTQGAPQIQRTQSKNGIQTYIKMLVNPKSIRFSQPKRYSRVDGVGGTVFHHFTDDLGRDNDVMTISFTGSTGNLDRRGSLGAPDRVPGALQSGTAIDQKLLAQQDTGALDRLLSWHNLYALSRETRLFTAVDRLWENRFYITYLSALFPIQIDFVGFFTKALDFSEEGTKPYSRDYQMEFVAEESDPPLEDFIAQLAQRIAAVKENPTATAQLLTVNTTGSF